MKNLTAVVGADTSGLEKSIKQAKTTLENFTKEAKKASNSIKENVGATSEQVASYKRSVRALEKVQAGTMSAEKAEKSLATQIQKLKEQWNSLNDTARRSDFGKAVSESYSSAGTKLREIRAEIAETKAAMQNSGASVSALGNSMTGLSGGLLKAMAGIQGTGGAISALSTVSKGLAASTMVATTGLQTMNVSSGLMTGGLTAGTGAMGLAVGAASKLATGLFDLAQEAKRFDGLMLNFKVNGLSDTEVEKLKVKIKEIADTFNMTKEEVVKVMQTIGNLAPQLKKNADALAYVSKCAIQLANAALIPVDNAARALITVLTQMNVSVAMSEDVINALAAAAHNGTADVDYLQQAIGICGKNAAKAGISYRELISTIETIAPNFSDAGDAGEKLNQVISRLISQGNEKFNPSVVGWQDALENLANANLSTAKMAELVGDSNVEMLKSLVNGREAIADFQAGMDNVKDTMSQAQENIEATKGAFDDVKKAWENLKATLADTSFTQAFNAACENMINKIAELIKSIDLLIQRWETFTKTMSKLGMWKDYLKMAAAEGVVGMMGGKKGAKDMHGKPHKPFSGAKEVFDETVKAAEEATKKGMEEGAEKAAPKVEDSTEKHVNKGAKEGTEKGAEEASPKVEKEVKAAVEEGTKKGIEEGTKKASTKFKKKSAEDYLRERGKKPNVSGIDHPSQRADTSGNGGIKFRKGSSDDYLKKLQEQARLRRIAEEKMKEAMDPEAPKSAAKGADAVKKAATATQDAAKKAEEFAEKAAKAMEAAAKKAEEMMGEATKPIPEPATPTPDPDTGGGIFGRKKKKKKKYRGPTGNRSGQGPAESTEGIDVSISQTGGELKDLGKNSEKAAGGVSDLAAAGGGLLKNLKGVAKAAGWVGATYMAVDALKDGAKTAMDFNSAMSMLQAVTGKSGQELEGLKNQALELGGTTKYSATEIASLQIALAKLGFDPTQIQAMTNNVQNLGTALATDLGSAAELTGATMRMFGLEAQDSQRIVDVFAASCSKSALDFGYLESAMSTVGPVANAFGLTLEDTVGLLGTLSNAGFDASSAATAARNIILNLADSNGDLAKTLGRTVTSGKDMLVALRDLKAGGIDLATALELTDKRSVAAFNTMMDGAESGYELMNALYAADGAAQRMSDTMSDNLEGDVAGLKSAWEALMLELFGGQDVIRMLVQEITDLIRILLENVKAIKEVYDEVELLQWILKGFLTAWVFVWNAALALIKTVVKATIGVLEGLYYALTFRFGKAKDAVVKNAKDIGQAWVDMAKKSIEQTEKIWKDTPELTAEAKIQQTTEGNSMPAVNPISPPPKKKEKKEPKGGKEETVYDEGSIGKLEQRISKLQEALKAAPTSALRLSIQREIDALEKQKSDIELELRPVLPEGSLALINQQIQDQENLLELAVDDKSRKKIQDEIDKLTGQKEAIELKLKPVIEEKDLESIAEQLAEHTYEVHAQVVAEKTSGERKTKAEKATSQAGMLKEELDFHKQILRSHKDEYAQIQAKIKAGGILNANERELANVYEEATKQVDRLTQAYEKASKAAMILQTKSQFKKALYNGVKGSIDTLGNLNNSISTVGSTWTQLAENWEDMTPFEQVTQGIGAVIGTIQEAFSAYESIAEMIQLFGDISAAASAKKIAADEAEMAVDTTKTATETANLGTKLANDAAENTSEIGKLGVKQAGAIASATSSGASLPFPANIAAIAAGIAAVVAAFSMVFSSFAEGGIISGATHNGDYNLARVNSGEMILNGTQQKRLFNLLNGSGGVVSSNTPKGQVDFKIRGKNLVGTLRNTNRRNSHI